MSARLPPASSPARPGDALATLWVNRGAINQRQDDTAACGSADRLATSTMRTVRMKPGGPTPDGSCRQRASWPPAEVDLPPASNT